MIEILVLISLSRNIAAKAREKGRSGGGFVVLLLALWFGGEIFGAIIAAVIGVVAMDVEEPPMALCYVGALAGAIVGALIAFAIVNRAAPAHRRDEYDDDDFERYERLDRDRDRY